MSASPPSGASRGKAAPPVFLHIGAMKTGTTYLQSVLTENKEQLADRGFLFPGDAWAFQVRAVQDALSLGQRDPKVRAASAGAWPAMARRVLAHEGVASIVSMELLGAAGRKAVDRMVSSLEPSDVHVVLTVRDATATIPAQWQTTVRSGQTISWPAFMRGIRSRPAFGGRWKLFTDPALVKFRKTQDIARMLEVWSRRVPPHRIHVVTVPATGSDPHLLWERFAQAVGLDPAVDSFPDRGANQSLGYASTELLRRVNLALGEIPLSDYNATVREQLAGRVLSSLSEGETRALIDRQTCEFGLAWNRRTRQAVLRTGAIVHGGLEDLPTEMTASHEARIDDEQAAPTEAELMKVAESAADGMRDLVERRARRARKRGIDVPTEHDVRVRSGSTTGGEASDPVAEAAAGIAALCWDAIELKRRLDAR